MRQVKALFRKNTGTTSIEYAVIAFLVSLSIIAGTASIGTKLKAQFTTIAANLS